MDYDIGVLGLASPPASAVVTSYRPAVQVRNNGIHNAIASGYLRIYAAGLLIFETEVYSGTLAPGATGTADAVDYWTPPAEGSYIINGYVTTPLDQYEPNNNLGPVTIVVKGGPVPPPPTVPLHAAQHEEGGTDPINVDGLPGKLTDQQDPTNHASQHQAGGDDTINVGGLAGVLGDPQTPIVHGNAHHSPAMATSADIAAHAGASSAHTAATNLANRETTGPESGLVKGDQLASSSEVVGDPPEHLFLSNDRVWRHTPAGSGGASLGVNAEPVTLEPLTGGSLFSMVVPLAWLSSSMQFVMQLRGYIHSLAATGASVNLELLLGAEQLGVLSISAEALQDRDFTLSAEILGGAGNVARGSMSFLSANGLNPDDVALQISSGNTLFALPASDTTISIFATFINAHPDTFLQSNGGYVRALHQPA